MFDFRSPNPIFLFEVPATRPITKKNKMNQNYFMPTN